MEVREHGEPLVVHALQVVQQSNLKDCCDIEPTGLTLHKVVSAPIVNNIFNWIVNFYVVVTYLLYDINAGCKCTFLPWLYTIPPLRIRRTLVAV